MRGKQANMCIGPHVWQLLEPLARPQVQQHLHVTAAGTTALCDLMARSSLLSTNPPTNP